jgi:cytochrome c-type biogenesis protein CcmH
MLKPTRLTTLLALLLLAFQVLAGGEPLEFDSPEQEARYNKLTLELRCLVCQNQNLADSDAQLAQDLRQEIFEMMQAGQTDDQIKEFMVDRYGDFVLYRPPMQSNTVALWVLPGAVLLLGAVAVFATVRKRNRRLAAQKQEGSS